MLTNTNDDYIEGDVVLVTTDNSKGIVVSQNQTFVNILFENYRIMPILRKYVVHENKHIDLAKIWKEVRG